MNNKQQNKINLMIDSLQGKERIVIPPSKVNYRGALKSYSKVKNRGILCLTEENIYYESIIGKNKITIPIKNIKKTELSKRFLNTVNFYNILIIHTKDENKIGFIIKNSREWIEKLNYLIA